MACRTTLYGVTPRSTSSASDAPADVGGAIRLALKRMAPVMATQSVKVDVAAPSGLLGRMRGAALADLLEELLTAAIHGAPGGRLLLTAAPHGDRIHVGVTDDVPGADPAIRAAGVRGLMERVALRGGSPGYRRASDRGHDHDPAFCRGDRGITGSGERARERGSAGTRKGGGAPFGWGDDATVFAAELASGRGVNSGRSR